MNKFLEHYQKRSGKIYKDLATMNKENRETYLLNCINQFQSYGRYMLLKHCDWRFSKRNQSAVRFFKRLLKYSNSIDDLWDADKEMDDYYDYLRMNNQPISSYSFDQYIISKGV